MARLTVHLLSLLLAATAGCDNSAPAPANAPGTVPTVFGAVRGKVTITGWTSPAPKIVQCGNHQVSIVDETVQMNSDGTLRNVIVYLKNAPPAAATATPAPAVMDQVNCVYKPHVLAIRTGQAVRFKSSDPTLHNVHTLCEENRGINIGMRQNDTRDLVFTAPEFCRVKCDVHPWMSAWVAVFAHPYYAMTADGGTFEIANIPAGPQTLIAWHERFGEIEQTVTISGDKTSEITFNFKPPRTE